MTNNNTNEQQLIKENEILSKIFLEMLLKHSDKMAKRNVEQRKTDEEIKEILSQPDWRKKTEFRIVSNEKGDWVGHWWSIPWLISVREPLTIIENLNKEKELKEALYNQSLRIVARQSKKNEEQEIKNKELEEKVKELTVFKEQVEDLEKKMVEILLGYSEITEEDREKGRIYWEIDKPQELLEDIEEGKINEVIIKIIDKWEQDAKVHYESLTEVSKEWNENKENVLKGEINAKSKLLEISDAKLLRKEAEKQQLKEESILMLAKAEERIKRKDERIEELERQVLLLSDKSLSKTPSKFKIFKERTKTKLQNLAEKTKHQSQKLFARIEVRTK